MARILEVRNLSKTFTIHILGGKKIEALDRVSFDVQEGEILGLVGASGAGKSTLMKCLYRTYLPSAGRIVYHLASGRQVDFARAPEHEVLVVRKNEVRYCSQFLQVIPRVPALDVVAQNLIQRRVTRQDAVNRAKALLERLRLPEELWDAYPSNFSGGEQQRINMARAIISEPRFLLVDEPTASLDRAARDAVIGMILELREKGSSVILISHDEETLSRLATRRLGLEAGRATELAAA
jgi:alpha-D-ribose 1-methylphosphonate 5-triphosphate synthase subunit PhnL